MHENISVAAVIFKLTNKTTAYFSKLFWSYFFFFYHFLQHIIIVMNDKGLWWWLLLVRRYSYCRCRRRRAAATDRCLSKIFFSFCVVVSSRSGRMFLAHAENMYSSIAYIHLNRVHRASHAATLQRTTNDHVARSKPVSFRRDVRQKHPNNRLEEVF